MIKKFKRILLVIFLMISIQVCYAENDSFILNIHNSKGGITPIAIKKSEGRYWGPMGEYYSNMPTVEEIQVNYGSFSLDEIQRSKNDQNLKLKMLNEMTNASILANQRKLERQMQVLKEQELEKYKQMKINNSSPANKVSTTPLNSVKVKPINNNFNQNYISNFLSEASRWSVNIFIILIFSSCVYTCFQATRGRMLFFYNWADVLGSVVLIILMFIFETSGDVFLAYLVKFSFFAYNIFLPYRYYQPKKQYMNLFLVALSRIIMSILIPVALIVGLFLGHKKDDNLFVQFGSAALQFGWYYSFFMFLNSLVNGHLLVELQEEATTSQHTKQQQVLPEKKTPYEILGVSPTDTTDKIKAVYKNLMMKYHPDRMGGLGEEIINFATIKTQEINEAYDVIMNSKGMSRG